ncbi:Avt1 protein [Martiniozyma asiatica (nom. inval.)]|nr:Avt1 protein [Martiniozyma asiatica]
MSNANYGSVGVNRGKPIPFSPSSVTQNSILGFASSYQRAQSYRSLSIDPRPNVSRSFFQDDEELVDPETFAPSPMGRKISTVFGSRPSIDNLRGAEGVSPAAFDDAIIDDVQSFKDYHFTDFVHSRAPSMVSNLMPVANSLSRVISRDSESVFLRQVDTHDGKTLTMLAPQSTVSQTIFNAINVLIGIGLLALSKAMTHAGWIAGIIFLFYSVAVTYWTATLLSDCMDTDPTLYTYADLGYKAFGPKGRLFISILFTVELCGVGVSLFVLFADSLHAIFPEISLNAFKWIGFCLLTPFSFLSLRVLSSISLFGIISTISLVFIILFCGLIKNYSPGSLIDPAYTNLYPPSILELFMSYGIILGPFGSHSLFPALKADLNKPKEFNKCLRITYAIGFFADTSMAIIGFLMFGAGILNEITKSVLLTSGYPSIIYALISLFVSMIPIAKTPINALPIINIIEFMFELTPQQLQEKQKNNIHLTSLNNASIAKPTNISNWKVKFYQAMIKIAVNLIFCICSILYPEFDKIIGLSGASLCSLICVVLPCAFYLKLVKPRSGRWKYWGMIFIGLVAGLISTYAAIVV